MRVKFNIAVFWLAHPLFFWMAELSTFWVLVGVAWSWVTLTVGLQIGAHRYFTHSSFETGPARAAMLNFLAILPCMGTPQDWMVAHIYHHRHSDTELDPTNVGVIGVFKNYSSLWQLNVPLTTETTRIAVRSLKPKRAKFFYENYIPILLAWSVGLLIFSEQAFAWLFLLPILVGHWAMNLLNHIGHDKNGAKTSALFNIITPGDGFHKFHHDNPRAARFHKYDLLGVFIEKALSTSRHQ